MADESRVELTRGELRYEFAARIGDNGLPVLDATFQGPAVGVMFAALSLSDARQLRDDMQQAVRQLEALFPRRR